MAYPDIRGEARAPVLRTIVTFYGANKLSMSIEAAERDLGGRSAAGTIFLCEPSNGAIIEKFRQMERATERRVVAVHKIIFPEDEVPTVQATTVAGDIPRQGRG